MKNIVLGLIVASLASNAVADESGAFAEILLGSAEQTATADGFDESSGDDLSFGVRGGFKFNPNVAVEVGYQNFGEAEENYYYNGINATDRFSSSAISAGVKGSLPFENGFTISARVGVSLWDLDLEYAEFGSTLVSASDDGNDFYYGIGGQMKVSEQFHIGAEYTVTELDASFGGFSVDHEIRNLALIVGYSF